jgi:hypothetical protein
LIYIEVEFGLDDGCTGLFRRHKLMSVDSLPISKWHLALGAQERATLECQVFSERRHAAPHGASTNATSSLKPIQRVSSRRLASEILL